MMADSETLDPQKIADEARPLRCPWCGSSVYREPRPGWPGYDQLRAVCTETRGDCPWAQVIAIDRETGHAKTVPDPSLNPSSGQAGGGRPEGAEVRICAVEGCGRRLEHRHTGLCGKHQQRWHGCGKPPVADFLRHGAPTPSQWQMRDRTVTAQPQVEKVDEAGTAEADTGADEDQDTMVGLGEDEAGANADEPADELDEPTAARPVTPEDKNPYSPGLEGVQWRRFEEERDALREHLQQTNDEAQQPASEKLEVRPGEIRVMDQSPTLAAQATAEASRLLERGLIDKDDWRTVICHALDTTRPMREAMDP
jgi:hypothetical protein